MGIGKGWVFHDRALATPGWASIDNQWEQDMRVVLGSLALLLALPACAARSEEATEDTRVATDTIVETRQEVDTLLVQTDTTVQADTSIAADTAIVADTTITADTSVAADTTVQSDTTRLDGGVIGVDTAPAE
jgi:hypothetical protein